MCLCCVSHFLSTIPLYKHEQCNCEFGNSNHRKSIRQIQFSVSSGGLHAGVLTDGLNELVDILMTITVNVSTRRPEDSILSRRSDIIF